MQIPDQEYLKCNVRIDFDNKTKSYNGVLSISAIKGIIEFCWEPEIIKPFDINICNFEESKIYFMLQQINTIQFFDDDNYALVVRFGLSSTSTFTRFLFDKDESELFRDVISKFEEAQLVQKHMKYKNIWKVLVSTKKVFLIPESILSLKHVQLLYSHRKVQKKLLKLSKRNNNKERFKFEQLIFDEKGRLMNFQEAKQLISNYGIENDSVRRIIWPYLFSVYNPEMTNEDKKHTDEYNYKRYCNYRKQCNLMTKQQKEQFKVKYSVIENDSVRTEKGNKLFKEDENGVQTYIRILFAFVLFDRDTDYTQGMGDYLAVLMILFIKEYINKDKVIFYDDSVKSITEAESFIFWNFVGLLRLTQNDLLFRDILNNQEFLTERTFEIASSIHPVLHNWFDTYNFSKLVFIYRSFLLLFKRDFDHEFVMRLWDIIFTCEKPKIFPRFFAAAMVIETFPAVTASDDLGSLIENYEKSIKYLSQDSLLDIAFYLYDKYKHETNSKYLFMEISKEAPDNFVSKYFKFSFNIE